MAAAATLAISRPAEETEPAYEIAIFSLAALACCRPLSGPRWPIRALTALAAFGFAQLLAGATVYRWASWQASLRCAAFAATAFAARAAFRDAALLRRWRRAMVWFGAAVSVVAVLAYSTSPNKILWIFGAVYPDNWGPFPSRNNFAQFLELFLPPALVEMARSRSRSAALAPALMLAAGLASASRAGSALLLLETLAAIGLLRNGRSRKDLPGKDLPGKNFQKWIWFAAAAALFTACMGAGTLLGRLANPEPLQYRREILGSAMEMTRSHPWTGYGLGTFAAVYPEFARFDSGASVEHAHNDWLEWAAEGGLPFAALWLGLAVSIAPRAVRSVWGLGVLAVFLHALVDYPFARLGVAGWVFVLIGALVSEREKWEAAATKGM